MFFLRSKRVLAALAVVLGLAACESGSDGSNHPTLPESFIRGSTYGGYSLANDPMPERMAGSVSFNSEMLTASATIGGAGGRVDLLGHSIVVPAGAVTEPKVFTITSIPGGYVEVDLRAGDGSLLDPDSDDENFAVPVTLTLTYERSTNVTDPSQLVVLRLNGVDGEPEALPSTVDLNVATITTQLDHFSRYAIAFPN
jgi:hypothetical protein